MADDIVPQYRTPGGIRVPAEVVALLREQFSLVGPDNPLPTISYLGPVVATDEVPQFRDPAGVVVQPLVVAVILADGSIVGPTNPLPTTGGGGGATTAEQVSLADHPGLDNVQEALDFLLYVPLQITGTGGGSNNEIGSSVASVNFTWSLNKAPTSQSLDHGVGTIPTTDRAHLFSGPFTTNTSFNLTASDGTTTRSGGVSVSFFPKRYWGVFPTQTPTDSDLLAMSQELASSRQKAITYNATGGNYPIYFYPKSFGLPANVTVGGLAFSDFSVDTRSFTNASGYTQDYYLVYFNGIQTGAAINVVWN